MPISQNTRVLHIDISGHDHAGVTHALTEILAASGARILDVGQAVIHDALALGILIELTDEMKSSSLLTELLLKAHELGVRIHFNAISPEAYEDWVRGQAKGRYIISVLGPSLNATHLAAVSGVIARAGLNIDRIDRLSGRTPLTTSGTGRVCIELSTSGDLASEDEMRAALMALTQEFDVDIAFQHNNAFRRNRRLVAFDMDSTLIGAEVIDELARRAGAYDQVAAITESAMRGELDFQQSFRRRVSLLKGLSASALQDVIDSVSLMDGAEAPVP